MSKYQELLSNKPKLTVKEGSTQVVVMMVASMCDNKHKFVFNKDDRGLFRLNTMGYSYSNFQIPADKSELEFYADSGDWDEIFSEINKGVQLIDKVMSR